MSNTTDEQPCSPTPNVNVPPRSGRYLAESIRRAVKLLEEATAVVRDKPSGVPPESHFNTVAALWSSVLDAHVCAADVALCMILLKVARLSDDIGGSEDSWRDIAGYAGLGQALDYSI